MIHLDLRAIAANIRAAATEDLLDRVTVYRDGMEPAAVDLIEGELARRGVSPEEVEAHDRDRRETALFRDDGTAVRCSFCVRPAVGVTRRWHRIGARLRWPAASAVIAGNSLVLLALSGWIFGGLSSLAVAVPVLLVTLLVVRKVPLFPRTVAYCHVHRPDAEDDAQNG